MRERWVESIFRTVIPTHDYSLPSEENLIETHKKMAKNKRGANLMNGVSGTDRLKVED